EGLWAVLLLEGADGVDVDVHPETALEGLGQLDRLFAVGELSQLGRRDRRRGEPCAGELSGPAEDGELGGCRHQVGEQAVTLFDDVVVVRNLIRSGVFDLGPTSRYSTEKPRRIEPHLEVVSDGRQRLDVTVQRDIAARPRHRCRRRRRRGWTRCGEQAPGRENGCGEKHSSRGEYE